MLRRICTGGAGSAARWASGMGRTCTLRDWSRLGHYGSGCLSSIYLIPYTFQVAHADVLGINDYITTNGHCITTPELHICTLTAFSA